MLSGGEEAELHRLPSCILRGRELALEMRFSSKENKMQLQGAKDIHQGQHSWDNNGMLPDGYIIEH